MDCTVGCTALDSHWHNFADYTAGWVSALLVIGNPAGCTGTVAGSGIVPALQTLPGPVMAMRTLSCTYSVFVVPARHPMGCTGHMAVDQAIALDCRTALDILHSDSAARADCWDRSTLAVAARTAPSDSTTLCRI